MNSTDFAMVPDPLQLALEGVKARAIELLRDGEINSYLPMALIAGSRWHLHGQISLAVCRARDELIPLELRVGRGSHFNKSAHAQTVHDIKNELLAGQHAEHEPKFSDFMGSAWPEFVASNDELYGLLMDDGMERCEASERADQLWNEFLAFRREQLRLARLFDAEVGAS
jgi:hypothetical protein